jgi:hypothetical protein
LVIGDWSLFGVWDLEFRILKLPSLFGAYKTPFSNEPIGTTFSSFLFPGGLSEPFLE